MFFPSRVTCLTDVGEWHYVRTITIITKTNLWFDAFQLAAAHLECAIPSQVNASAHPGWKVIAVTAVNRRRMDMMLSLAVR